MSRMGRMGTMGRMGAIAEVSIFPGEAVGKLVQVGSAGVHEAGGAGVAQEGAVAFGRGADAVEKGGASADGFAGGVEEILGEKGNAGEGAADFDRSRKPPRQGGLIRKRCNSGGVAVQAGRGGEDSVGRFARVEPPPVREPGEGHVFNRVWMRSTASSTLARLPKALRRK